MTILRSVLGDPDRRGHVADRAAAEHLVAAVEDDGLAGGGDRALAGEGHRRLAAAGRAELDLGRRGLPR